MSGPERALPFTGLRVVDLGTFWAAPYLTCYLGSLGADVVKVESAARPDAFRFSATFPRLGADWYERSGVWQSTNLNKRDVTLDLTRPEGRDLLRGLIAGADVVVENYSARVVEQFGFDEPAVREIRPDVIMVRMPGFGLDGPWRDYVGWAMAFEQAAGLAWITGFPGGPPMNPGGFVDPVVGMHAAVAVQAALEHRRRTGEGQLIEVAQVETAACLVAEQVGEHARTGALLAAEGNRSPEAAPQGVYRCRGEDEWVAVGVPDDPAWAALCRVMGIPHTDDDLAARHARHDEIDAAIAAWTATRTVAEVVGELRTAGIAVSGLLAAQEMYDEPQLVAREYFQEIDHPRTGRRRHPVWPMRFSAGPARHHRPAPTLGQHNDEVLGELGLDPATIAALRADGVIGESIPS